jgi:hypothetical protein
MVAESFDDVDCTWVLLLQAKRKRLKLSSKQFKSLNMSYRLNKNRETKEMKR